jgi:hypothetical protein
LIRFIEFILNSEDHRYVYFVTIEQALEWLKYPRTLSQLEDFWAFNCRETIYEYDIDCSDAEFSGNKKLLLIKEEAKRLTSKNETNSTDSEPLDRQSEELFRSGIVIHSVWIFILLILSVLFYDNYFANK